MMINTIISLFFLSLLFFIPFDAQSDIIHFKNGKKIQTSKVWAEGNMVKCILYDGEVTFHPSEIEKVERTESNPQPKSAAISDQKTEAESNKARGLAQEAYEIATSAPSGGPSMGKVHELLESARAINPDEAEIFLVEMIKVLQDGHVFGTWYRSSSFKPGTLEKAADLAREAIQADPQYSKGYSSLAWMMIANERFDEAESLLKTAYSLDSDSVYYWLYQGTLLMLTERYNEALHAYNNANSYTLSNVLQDIIKIRKRDLAKLRGDVEEALRLYGEEIQRDPDSPYSWGNYGTYLVCQGRFDEAIPYLTKAVEISPYPLALLFLEFAKTKTASAAKCKDA